MYQVILYLYQVIQYVMEMSKLKLFVSKNRKYLQKDFSSLSLLDTAGCGKVAKNCKLQILYTFHHLLQIPTKVSSSNLFAFKKPFSFYWQIFSNNVKFITRRWCNACSWLSCWPGTRHNVHTMTRWMLRSEGSHLSHLWSGWHELCNIVQTGAAGRCHHRQHFANAGHDSTSVCIFKK